MCQSQRGGAVARYRLGKISCEIATVVVVWVHAGKGEVCKKM